MSERERQMAVGRVAAMLCDAWGADPTDPEARRRALSEARRRVAAQHGRPKRRRRR